MKKVRPSPHKDRASHAEGDWNLWARGPRLLGILLLLAVCGAYANSFQNAFEFDDFHTVTDNPAVRSLGNVPRFFTDAETFSVLPANRTYRPVVSASLALDYALGRGYVPFWFHLSTFCWFLLLIYLLFLFSQSIYRAAERRPSNGYVALFAAAWFGLHPAVAETVNYVIQRGDLYCTLGCVAALVVWMRYPQRRRTGLYLVPFALALLSKPPAAVFPILLFFFVYFFETPEVKGRRGRALLAALPSLGVTVALLLLQSAMTPRSFVPSELSPWGYRGIQPYVWLRYFGSLFLPVHLNVDSDLAAAQGVDARVASGLVFLVALAFAVAFTFRRKRLHPIAYGLIWFVVTQLPTSLYPLSEVENDHRMFFSFAGLIPAAVWAAWLGLQRLMPDCLMAGPRRKPWCSCSVVAGSGLLLLLFGCGVHVRNATWHNEESLWLDNVQKSPHNGRGLMIYGLTQMNKGAYPSALDYFTRALVFTPNYPTLEVNLGVVYGAMNRAPEAEMHFLRALALNRDADVSHAFYARWLLGQGRLREAAAEAQQAVQLNSARQMQHDILMDTYRRLGDAALVHQAAVATLIAVPGDLLAQSILQHPATSGHEVQAGPSVEVADLVNRSLALNQAGNYAESITLAKQATELDPTVPEAWNNIAAGEQALHHWDSAIAAAQRAISLRPDFQLAKNNLAWSESQRAQGK